MDALRVAVAMLASVVSSLPTADARDVTTPASLDSAVPAPIVDASGVVEALASDCVVAFTLCFADVVDMTSTDAVTAAASV